MPSRLCLTLVATILLTRAAFAQDLGFKVPPGFEVSLYADDTLATDIHSLTIDAKGRVVVAGKGYVKILHDTTGKGKADKATLFSTVPKSGAHGMYFDGPDLICNGDGGVRRLYDTTGSGKVDKVSPLWLPTKNDGEHAANGIVRGPDGWYYLIAGNDAGITREHASNPTSPIKIPNSGAVVRFSPDGTKREVVAHGFRNPYDLAFNHLGDLFTVDADGERIHHMPYYAPTRLFDIGTGMHHGWLTPGWMRGWSRPPYMPDNVERLVELGRGSPTGLIVYRHRAFPTRYLDGVFSLCWTFGRVYFCPLTPRGSTYDSKMEVFMETTGDVGFAPTDMAVGPDGALFIAIGGRGTRGGVFRVRYKGAPLAVPGSDLDGVLTAYEPLSSWSRARWVPLAQKVGKDAFIKTALDPSQSEATRIRAIEVLTELFGGIPLEAAAKIDLPPSVAARATWSVSRTQSSEEALKYLVNATQAPQPRPARAAWEALLALPGDIDPKMLGLGWAWGLTSDDRRVRAAAIQLAQNQGRAHWARFYADLRNRTVDEQLVLLWLTTRAADKAYPFCRAVIGDNRQKVGLRLEAIRLLQLGLGDIETDEKVVDKAFLGYVARSANTLDAKTRSELAAGLLPTVPAGDRRLDLEIARLLAMFEAEAAGLPERIARLWTKSTSVEDDIHYLLCLSRIPGPRSADVSKQTATALAGIHGKLARRGAKPSDQVPSIFEALLDRLLKWDPALAAALVNDPAFGVPGHALFASRLPIEQKQVAARKLLAGVSKLDEDEAHAAWSPEIVRLVSTLPDAEALPILRRQFKDPRLTDTIALILAQKRQAEDRGRLIEAFSSTQASVITAAADALLADKSAKATPTDIGKAVRALRRLQNQKGDAKSHAAVYALLLDWTGAQHRTADSWVEWYTKTYAKEAATLPGLASADFATWKKRLDKIDWEAGDIKKGEAVFQRKNCFRCHGEARRLGPELTGIGQRFSRDDLFTAIIDPNKDISPAFTATTVVTKAGKSYNGMVIYVSPEIYLLQITPDTTARIPREEMQLAQPSAVSFMPSGLLDDATDADLRDLYAYLRTLRKK